MRSNLCVARLSSQTVEAGMQLRLTAAQDTSSCCYAEACEVCIWYGYYLRTKEMLNLTLENLVASRMNLPTSYVLLADSAFKQ